MLVDKGFVGLANTIRVIRPKKKPPRRELTAADALKDRQISSDRIIVENFFGRLCTLWVIVQASNAGIGPCTILFSRPVLLSSTHI